MAPALQPNAVLADSRPVLKARVVAHTTGAVGPSTSENHWTIFLLLSETQAIRVNMRAVEYGETRGILEWTFHNYTLSGSAIASWDFTLATGVTVGHVASLLYGLGRDNYEMSGGGSGCRWWIFTAISDMAKWYYVGSNAPAQIHPELHYLYHTSLPRKPLHMVKGTFEPRYIQAAVDGPPGQQVVTFTINGLQKRTWLSAWSAFQDPYGRRFRMNDEYNLFINDPINPA